MIRKINVIAGLVWLDGRVLIGQRAEEKHGGLWEFPGGKLEKGETPRLCLQRELKEELGINAEIGELFLESNWLVGDKEIVLKTYQVKSFTGDPTTLVHRELSWRKPVELQKEFFLPADRPVVEKLSSLSD